MQISAYCMYRETASTSHPDAKERLRQINSWRTVSSEEFPNRRRAIQTQRGRKRHKVVSGWPRRHVGLLCSRVPAVRILITTVKSRRSHASRLVAQGSKNVGRFPTCRSGGGWGQPESQDVKSGSLVSCDPRPSSCEHGEVALEGLGKATFSAILRPIFADFLEFFLRDFPRGRKTARKRPRKSHLWGAPLPTGLVVAGRHAERFVSCPAGGGSSTFVPCPQSRLGEIGENAPNEAKFAETTTIAEAPESIQVTANSGALSGLDKRVAEPGKDSTRKPGEGPRVGKRDRQSQTSRCCGVGRCAARSVR